MNPKRFSIRLAIVLLLAISVVLLGSTVGLPRKEAGRGSATIALKAPAFVGVASAQDGQRSGTNFLEQEAGLSAYANAGRTINLSNIRPVYRTIERETGDYLIGSVPATDYTEAWDVHVFAHRDGWVVAYYLNNEPAVKIMDWRHYNGAAALDTQLDNVLKLVLNMVGVIPSQISYYHFRYPNATHVMIVADYEGSERAWDTFQVQIPGTFIVYERAWLHVLYAVGGSGSQLRLDDVQLNNLPSCYQCWQEARYGELQLQQLLPEQLHTVSLYNDYKGDNNGHSVGAVSLIYQEASQ